MNSDTKCNEATSGGQRQVAAYEVVVSGLSGRLPESDNIAEFRHHLQNGDDMVTEDARRWEPGMYGLPRRSGKLKDLSKFDATMFGVHPKQANGMDPQLRMLLEVTFEAIVDAGVNPQSVRGSRTGVFIGCSASEAHEAWAANIDKLSGYEMTGCTRSMFANRLSYFFDFKGPSYAVDTACSSSLLALDQALQSIRAGLCDAAIVGGSSLCLKPSTTAQFQKLGMLSADGACKSFDASGNGYCRSEAVVAVYLQKSTAAKRIYATLVHSKNNSDGFKDQGITFPSGAMQKRLLLEVYGEAGVDPNQVAYVELHGTGTKVGDPQEVNSVVDVFCTTDRDGPLLIGSTKSNMGHPEPASGLAALAKVLIAMEDRVIPANLHFRNPNLDIPGLTDGRLKVVSQSTSWNGGYVGINSFGFGGSNVHVLLKSNDSKSASDAHPAKSQTRLVTCCGRTEESVQTVIKELQQHPDNVEMQYLIEESLGTLPISTHPYRGATILNSTTDGVKHTSIQKCVASEERRPVWFVFAGMGTQWSGMGRDLMAIDVFHESIMRSDAIMQEFGIKLYDLLMQSTTDTFNDTLNSFIGIAAIQVALVDVLRALHIEADGIVGHSVGELGCAYADGCLTAAETVLAAYWRGRCVTEGNLPPGRMAAVGLTWEEAHRRCPEGVVPACHNSHDTVTISGPADVVSTFVSQLQAEGIFAREVQSSGVAFHSHYMAMTAPALREKLEKVITKPRRRSPRWISSSIPESQWASDLALCSSAEYHVNNLVSPVLFQEALQHVPKNAIAIEIAPHCLLQAILKRSLDPECVFVGMMNRNQTNNMDFLLTSLGKLHLAGVNFNPLSLYPSVSLPVPPSTPMLSSLVQWDHSMAWEVPTLDQFEGAGSGSSSGCTFDVDISSSDSEDKYLDGHVIDGRVLFPATGYLVLAWKVLAKMTGRRFDEMDVVFDDVQIHTATILPHVGSVMLDVTVAPGSGQFEVCEAGSRVVSGRVSVPDTPPVISYDTEQQQPIVNDNGLLKLNSEDIYKELRLRGYDYGPTFRGIVSATNAGDKAELLWADNWVTFLDTMLQTQVLSLPGRDLRLPTRIRSLRINTTLHKERITQLTDNTCIILAENNGILGTCVSGGCELLGLHATVAPRRNQSQTAPILESYVFTPYSEYNIAADIDIQLVKYATECQSFVLGHTEKLVGTEISSNGLKNIELMQKIVCSAKALAGQDKVISTATSATDQHVMLKLLQDIYQVEHDERFSQNVVNLIEANSVALMSDPMYGGLVRSERCLKNCLDVVLENCLSDERSKLKIVEYGGSRSRIYQTAIRQLQTQPGVQLDYCITGPGLESLDSDSLSQLQVETITWDVNTTGPTLPSRLSEVDLIIAADILHRCDNISNALTSLKTLLREGGFLLVIEPTDNLLMSWSLFPLIHDISYMTDLSIRSFAPFCSLSTWTELITGTGLQVVALKSDGVCHTSFLCRKPVAVTAVSTVVIDVSDAALGWVDEIKAALTMSEKSDQHVDQSVWLRALTAPHSGVIGLVNCLRREPNGHRIRCVFNGNFSEGVAKPADLPSNYMLDAQRKSLVQNVYRNGSWGSFRHISMVSAYTVETSTAYVNVLTRGDLSSLSWIESPLKYFNPAVNPTKQLCTVHYAALNFRDIMLATGKLPPDAIPGDLASQSCLLGMEFSGKDSAGNRIMGLLAAKGLATVVDADSRFLWPVPSTWTLEQAATVPVAYSTAYYALVVRGQIRAKEAVLIHAGSGAVGQAAIAIALNRGCTVYTTVSSELKKQHLIKLFPQLTEVNFANSRDSQFWRTVLRSTRGRGVDVVLNSLSEDKLQSSVQLLAQHGRFLEIGKFDLSNNTALGMAVFLRNISFHGILLDALFDEGNVEWQAVADLVSDGLKDGVVKPLSLTVFDRTEIEAAFRFMAQGKHVGKVLVKISDEKSKESASPIKVSAVARTICNPDKSYVIVGGLGGFGLELAQWLIERGCHNLILTSRSGVRSGYQSRLIRQWRSSSVNVMVSTDDVSHPDQATELIKKATSMGPLGGVFNLAMVLLDGLMDNQTVERFAKVLEPKVAGTTNLDIVTRRICSDSLEWFVVFSSVSCGRGNAGQSNYGFANSSMERICEQRRHDGLPGLAIQWGAIGDVGIVVDTMKGSNESVIGGTLPQRIHSCLATLDVFLNQAQPVVSSFVLATLSKSRSQQSSGVSLRDKVAHILGIKEGSKVDNDTTLGDLGLDSLMGVEVKQTLERDHDINVPIADIRLLTFTKIDELSKSSTPPPASPPNAAQIGDNSSSPSSPSRNKLVRTGSIGSPTAQSESNELTILVTRQSVVKLHPGKTVASGGNKRVPLFIVHPIEGTVEALKTVASLLDSPVYGLQYTADAPTSSIQALASHYIQKVVEICPVGPYHLAGYSFGGCVAVEMALQMESTAVSGGDSVTNGGRPRLVLLDGSHAYVAANLQRYKDRINASDHAQAETEAICQIITHFVMRLASTRWTQEEMQKLVTEMLKCPDFDSRIKVAISSLLAAQIITNKDTSVLKTSIKAFYARLVMAECYKPGSQLKSTDVVLIRASQGIKHGDNLGQDYGLSEVCTRPVAVHIIDGSHETFITGNSANKVAEIVNAHLVITSC